MRCILKAYLSQVSDSIQFRSAGIVIVYAFQWTLIGLRKRQKKNDPKKSVLKLLRNKLFGTQLLTSVVHCTKMSTHNKSNENVSIDFFLVTTWISLVLMNYRIEIVRPLQQTKKNLFLLGQHSTSYTVHTWIDMKAEETVVFGNIEKITWKKVDPTITCLFRLH